MAWRVPRWERATLEVVLLVPLALASILTNRLLPWAALFSSLFLIWRMLRLARTGLRRVLDWHRLAPFAGGLLFMLAVSVLITIAPEETLTQVERVVLGLATCLAIRDWAQQSAFAKNRIRFLHLSLVGLGLALAAASPFVVEWQGSKLPSLIPPTVYSRFTLLTADGANPNVMAGALALLWPLALSPVLGWAKPGDDIASRGHVLVQGVFWLGAIGIVAMLALTQSRGAWMGSAAGVLVLANLRVRRLWLATVVLIGVVLIVALLMPTQRAQWAELLSAGGNISGSAERVEIWTHAWYVIQDFSFTGVGMGNFRRVNELFYPLYIAPADAPHAHNLFMQVAVDIGIPGFLMWLGLFGHSLAAAIQAYRRSTSSQIRALSAGLIAAQVALAVHGLTDAVVWGVMRTALITWFIWGVALALRAVDQRQMAS